MKMLRDTCLQESGSEEGKCAPSARRHVKLCLKYSNAFLQSITSDSTIIFVSHMTGKQSLHKPGEVQRVPGGWGSQISRQSHMKVVTLSATRIGRLYPQKIILVLISVRGWVELRAIVRLEWSCKRKIPMTPPGIEPATCQLVAQYLS